MSVRNFWVLYEIFWNLMYALNVLGLSFGLLGHLVMTHLVRLRFIYDNSANFCNLVICGWMWWMLSVVMARSFA